MKKRGFTLLELIAVIIIIAVIILITVPVMLGVITKAKLQTLRDSAYGVLEASGLYYAQYRPASSIRFDINNNIITSDDTAKLIKYNGSIKRGTIIIDKNGLTTLCITDGTNSAYKNSDARDVTVVEKDTCYIP